MHDLQWNVGPYDIIVPSRISDPVLMFRSVFYRQARPIPQQVEFSSTKTNFS